MLIGDQPHPIPKGLCPGVSKDLLYARTQYHSVARQCVHCCKGDAASQWEMAILGCQNSVIPVAMD